MLDKVKLALRISTTALDRELQDLIDAAIADLRLVGVPVPEEGAQGDPLLDRAVILYAKAEYGYGGDPQRYRAAYDYLKCALCLSGEHGAREATHGME